MIFASRLAGVALAALMCWTVPAASQTPQRQPGPSTYGPEELTGAGHKFFGNVSRGLD
jgi:hypothetical protein